jgi:hypothetical protein
MVVIAIGNALLNRDGLVLCHKLLSIRYLAPALIAQQAQLTNENAVHNRMELSAFPDWSNGEALVAIGRGGHGQGSEVVHSTEYFQLGNSKFKNLTSAGSREYWARECYA